MRRAGAVVREVLRITPVVPALFRRALVDINLDGRLIPQVMMQSSCLDLDFPFQCLALRLVWQWMVRLCMQGWNVYVHTGAATQKYNKDAFEPERWLQGRPGEQNTGAAPAGACQHAEHSLPFGLGPRMCLGRYFVEASLKVLALELVRRRCTWQLQDEQEQWSVFPTVRPQGGLPVTSFRLLAD